jgi:hypothetical protein
LAAKWQQSARGLCLSCGGRTFGSSHNRHRLDHQHHDLSRMSSISLQSFIYLSSHHHHHHHLSHLSSISHLIIISLISLISVISHHPITIIIIISIMSLILSLGTLSISAPRGSITGRELFGLPAAGLILQYKKYIIIIIISHLLHLLHLLHLSHLSHLCA